MWRGGVSLRCQRCDVEQAGSQARNRSVIQQQTLAEREGASGGTRRQEPVTLETGREGIYKYMFYTYSVCASEPDLSSLWCWLTMQPLWSSSSTCFIHAKQSAAHSTTDQTALLPGATGWMLRSRGDGWLQMIICSAATTHLLASQSNFRLKKCNSVWKITLKGSHNLLTGESSWN